jgi:hypothetical protein
MSYLFTKLRNTQRSLLIDLRQVTLLVSTDGSQSNLSAGDSQRKRPCTAPIVIHDGENTQDEGTQSPPDKRRQGHGYSYGHRCRNNDGEYHGRHRKPVRFHQPHEAEGIGADGIRIIPKDLSIPVNTTESTWRETFRDCFNNQSYGPEFAASRTALGAQKIEDLSS